METQGVDFSPLAEVICELAILGEQHNYSCALARLCWIRI